MFSLNLGGGGAYYGGGGGGSSYCRNNPTSNTQGSNTNSIGDGYIKIQASTSSIVESSKSPSKYPTASPVLQTQTFSYTGYAQSYVVPSDIYYLSVIACGAKGASGYYSGGYGGCMTCKISVTPSETLYVYVGGYSTYGGYNGGGDISYSSSGGGGGASDVRQSGSYLSNRVVVGGGGGGGGYGSGGSGGGSTASSGYSYYGTNAGGGSQYSGGSGGYYYYSYYSYYYGSYGTLGYGGDGAYYSYSGGGGGGYYGGFIYIDFKYFVSISNYSFFVN
jgi:hypothetical protein